MSPTVGTLGPSLAPDTLPHTPSPALCPQFAWCPPPPQPPGSLGCKIKGRKSLKQTPACPQNRLLCKFPKRNACVGKGRVAHAQLYPEKGIILFFRRCQERFRLQDLPLILRIYIFFFFQGYFGSSCCRKEERGRSRRFDLFLLRQNFAGEGPTRHGERDSTHARQRQCPRPPAPASRGAEPGRSLDFRGKKIAFNKDAPCAREEQSQRPKLAPPQ